MKLAHSIKSKSGEEVAHSGRKINAATLKEIQKAKISEIEVDVSDLEGAWAASDVVDTTTGEVLLVGFEPDRGSGAGAWIDRPAPQGAFWRRSFDPGGDAIAWSHRRAPHKRRDRICPTPSRPIAPNMSAACRARSV